MCQADAREAAHAISFHAARLGEAGQCSPMFKPTYATTIGTAPSGFSFGGAITFVLERQDGGWKIVAGHTSSPARR